jgi:hypothetical protein
MLNRTLRAAGALLGLVAAPLLAQPGATRPALSLSAGVSQYDLSGTGTTAVYAARLEQALRPALLVEGGVAVARPDQQFGRRSTLIIPEIGLQAQYPARVAPYLGVGLGAAIDRRHANDGGTRSEMTASGAAGVRAWATERVGLRGELRVRGIGTGFEGSTAEWTLGAAVRF